MNDIEMFFVKLCVVLVATIVCIYDLLTFVFYLIWQRPWRKWPLFYRVRSVPSASITVQKLKKSIQHSSIKHLPSHFLVPCLTIDEALKKAVQHHGENTLCIGYREVIDSKPAVVEGKSIIKVALTEYKWLTYGQMYQFTSRFGHGLRQLGVAKGDLVMIYADTGAKWLISAQAIITNGSVLVTLYSTLGEQGIKEGFKQTGVKYLITSTNLIEKLIDLQSCLNQLQHIVLLDCTDHQQWKDKWKSNVTFHTFDELIQSGDSQYFEQNPVNIDENDLAIIMYTSGSGGMPKGVMITHKNFMRGLWAMLSVVYFFLHEMSRHTYIGYLPLAHILEFSTETYLMLTGCRIGYSSPHTITDLSAGLMEGTKGDATLLQPTLMASVPLVLDRIRKAIYARLQSKGMLAVKLFEFVIAYKHFWNSKGFDTPIVDRVFLDKFRQIVGGKLEILMTGGAPLSADTQKFIRSCLNVTFSQGYGSTETVGSGLFMDQYDQTLAKVGGPLYGTEVKLVDWPNGGYCTTDKPNPRGEIHLASESLSVGYFKLEHLTTEAYYWQNGVRWFKTGDIGELFPNGCFKIIDRKKDFIKLQFGEYISLGKIETKLKSSYLVNNICIVGNSLYSYVIAIVVPNPKVVLKLARLVGCGGTTQQCGTDNKNRQPQTDIGHSHIHGSPYSCEAVAQVFLQKLTRFARANGLRRYEIPKEVILIQNDWTPESGLVTASFKLKRKNIEQHYAEQIQAAFGKLD